MQSLRIYLKFFLVCEEWGIRHFLNITQKNHEIYIYLMINKSLSNEKFMVEFSKVIHSLNQNIKFVGQFFEKNIKFEFNQNSRKTED
jgi:hypothetical protein